MTIAGGHLAMTVAVAAALLADPADPDAYVAARDDLVEVAAGETAQIELIALDPTHPITVCRAPHLECSVAQSGRTADIVLTTLPSDVGKAGTVSWTASIAGELDDGCLTAVMAGTGRGLVRLEVAGFEVARKPVNLDLRGCLRLRRPIPLTGRAY